MEARRAGGSWPRRAPGGPPVVLAHRGGRGPWRENTLDAFAGARLEGADGVELDVRLSADGVPIVHHDAGIDGVGELHALAATELPDWVPSLPDALEACEGWAVNVEIKNGPGDGGFDPDQAVARHVAELVGGAATGSKRPAHVVVSSFWPATLEAMRACDPAVSLGLLTHPAQDAAGALDAATDLACRAVHLHHSQVDREVVAEAHRRGMAVVTWTVNLASDVDAVARAGVDALITDEVTTTLALVRAT